MADLNKSSRGRRLLLRLTIIVGLTLLAIGLFVFRNRPTVAELRVVTRGAQFEVLPPAVAARLITDERDAPRALQSTPLLAALKVRSLEVQGAGCIQTTLAEAGPVALYLQPGGNIAVRSETDFQPQLTLHASTRITFEVSGQGNLRMWLAQDGEETALAPPEGTGAQPRCPERIDPSGGWNGLLPVGEELSVELQNVRSAGAGGTDSLPPGLYHVPANATRFTLASGRGVSRLYMAPSPRSGPSTVMRVLDPANGSVSDPKTLPVVLTDPRSLPWQDRLVLLDPDPGDNSPVPILERDLKILRPDFTRQRDLFTESFIAGGKVRFPAGEKESFDLEPDFYLSLAIDPESPLTLRSIDLSRGSLEMVLWGELESLKVGPTAELQTERLPNYFEWLYTNRLAGLAYGALAWIVTVSLAVFNLFRPSES